MRLELRRELLARSTPVGKPTVLIDVLADAFIDRCAEAADDATGRAVADWIAVTCRDRFNVPAVRRLVLGLGPALSSTLGHDGFEDLTAELARLVKEASSQAAPPAADTVDELDLLLGGMVASIESNDPITAEHCRAVSAWCARIAQRLSLTRREATFVARGGLIHDVGKSTTPHDILQAPRQLTEAEWIVMREHVTTGHDIVRDEARLRDFAPIVRSHHERFDGNGYPDRLDRARIPIAVRIVTVADAFNAMIGRRPYRTPLAPDRATFELRRCAGTQFDPNVVAALVDVVSHPHQQASAEGAVAC